MFNKNSLYIIKYNVTVWRGCFGAEKLRIGALAQRTNVTNRTIDYYTRIGLLKAERSASNYRYYDNSSIERIEFIEQRKKEGLSLEEIKQEIFNKHSEEIDIAELRHKMINLEKEVSDIVSHLDKYDKEKYGELKQKISHESVALIQTLLLFLS